MHFPSGPEILVLLIILLLLFGAKRLPELGRSIGQGMKEFKRSLNTIDEPEEQTKHSGDQPSGDKS